MPSSTPHKTTPTTTRGEKLVVLLVALAGTLLSALLLTWYFDRDNHWHRIVAPPGEKAVEILALDRGLNAYVKTAQGNVYLCGGWTWRDICRKVAASEVPTNKAPVRWTTCGPAFPEHPPAPGNVVSEIAVGQCAGGSTYSKLVILDDGSLWQWQRTFSWANGFALVSGVGVALGLSLAAGWAVVRVRRYLRGA